MMTPHAVEVYILESSLELQYFMEIIICNNFCKNNKYIILEF